MARSRTPSIFVLLPVLGLLACLPGCGDEAARPSGSPREGGGAADPSADWSGHAGGDVGDAATGSPDGATGSSPGALLARLRARVAGGRGMADPDYERDVRDVAEVLWPADGTPEQRAGAQVHVQLTAVASQVGGWLVEGPEARAARAETNAVDLAIHDAFLAASEAGPASYRRWCEDAGAGLLKKLADARRARFFPPR